MVHPNEEREREREGERERERGRDGGTQFPEDGLLFRAKMKWAQGVVVSDASELLFEDIKKLNAQQRPDVPTCLIYTPISRLPMSTEHQQISAFLEVAHSSARDEESLVFLRFFVERQSVCLSPGIVGRSVNGPSLTGIILRWKFNEREAELCNTIDAETHSAQGCTKPCPDPNTCTGCMSGACVPAHVHGCPAHGDILQTRCP